MQEIARDFADSKIETSPSGLQTEWMDSAQMDFNLKTNPSNASADLHELSIVDPNEPQIRSLVQDDQTQTDNQPDFEDPKAERTKELGEPKTSIDMLKQDDQSSDSEPNWDDQKYQKRENTGEQPPANGDAPKSAISESVGGLSKAKIDETGISFLTDPDDDPADHTFDDPLHDPFDPRYTWR